MLAPAAARAAGFVSGTPRGAVCLRPAAVGIVNKQLRRLETELKAHTTIEDELFCPALKDVAKADVNVRKERLKHSISQSARFLANTPAVCKASYVHLDVQDAFGDEALGPASLFTGPQGAGLTRGRPRCCVCSSKGREIEMTAHSPRRQCVARITAGRWCAGATDVMRVNTGSTHGFFYTSTHAPGSG